MAARRGVRLRAGRYELERLLGRGGAASVWLARDTLLERSVAVKLLSEALAADHDWMARFRREARIAARLEHPNLVSIYDFEAEAEQPYLVMAYMPGGSLADRLERGDTLDPERVAGDLLRALGHIHAAGIIHRDVKPANVLLDHDDRACLTDFGIARPEDATSITQTGQIPGTARYMAPELWRGEPASERTDLFACGVVLSQCLGDDTPTRLIGLVERLTAENPELRPQSASEALARLDRGAAPRTSRDAETTATAAMVAAADEIEGPRAAGPEAHSGPSTASRRWPAIAGLAALAALVAVAIAGALGGSDGEPERSPTAQRTEDRGGGERNPETQPRDTEPTGEAETTAPVESAEPSAVELNDEGYALIQQGGYDEAIPLLEQAVELLRGSGDITYAYALYNLGNALRLAGRPAEAIPVLEARLEIDNQTEVVKAELERAKEDLKAQQDAAKEAKKERKEQEKEGD